MRDDYVTVAYRRVAGSGGGGRSRAVGGAEMCHRCKLVTNCGQGNGGGQGGGGGRGVRTWPTMAGAMNLTVVYTMHMNDDTFGESDRGEGAPLPGGEASPAEPAMLRAYVNERAVSVAYGAAALDAVRAFDVSEAEAVTAGTRRITDSRGLPADPSTPVHGGAIFRVVPVRALPDDAVAAAGLDEGSA